MLIALAGKPSVGKSSFFKAATLASAEVANYPFTTVKSSEATGYVSLPCVDIDFGKQCDPRMGYCVGHQRFVPIRLMDVPGLIEGSHEGLGMGNLFLDDLNQANALVHVIDVSGSTNEKGEAVEPGSYDPANDIRFLEEELDMWYLRILQKGWDKFVRQQQAEKGESYKGIAKQMSGLRVTEDIAKEVLRQLAFPVELREWTAAHIKHLASSLRVQTKPMIIAANKVDIASGKENYGRLRKEFPDYRIIPCSAESELALKEAAKKDLIAYVPGASAFVMKEGLSPQQEKGLGFIKANVLDVYGNTGVQAVLDVVGFELLHMIAIFPGGVNKLEDKDGNCLPDCFLVKAKSTALDFAFRLHTDIGKGFIRAIDVKTKRTVGKEHVLQHRDVIEIITTA